MMRYECYKCYLQIHGCFITRRCKYLVRRTNNNKTKYSTTTTATATWYQSKNGRISTTSSSSNSKSNRRSTSSRSNSIIPPLTHTTTTTSSNLASIIQDDDKENDYFYNNNNNNEKNLNDDDGTMLVQVKMNTRDDLLSFLGKDNDNNNDKDNNDNESTMTTKNVQRHKSKRSSSDSTATKSNSNNNNYDDDNDDNNINNNINNNHSKIQHILQDKEQYTYATQFFKHQQQQEYQSTSFKPLFQEIDDIMESKNSLSALRKMQKEGKQNENHYDSNQTTKLLNSIFDTILQPNHNKSNNQNINHETPTTTDINGNQSLSITSEPKKKSIFDVFPIKPKTKNNNPNAFDKCSYETFKTIVEDIIQNESVESKRKILNSTLVKDWLLKDEPLLDYNYTVLSTAAKNGITTANMSNNIDDNQGENDDQLRFHKKSSFRNDVYIKGSEANIFLKQINEQKERFLAKSGLNDKQYTQIVKIFSILAAHCAKTGSNASMSVAWEKIKEAGIIPSQSAMNTCLYVSGTMGLSLLSSLSQQNLSQQAKDTASNNNKNNMSAVMNILDEGIRKNDNSIKEEEKEEEETIDLPTELAIFHDLLFEPTEKSISLRVKRLVSQGNAEEAERLLDSFPTNDDAKLRTYLPVLKLYCDKGNVSAALKLFKRMRDEPSVRLGAENYILLISSLMENGCFRNDADDIDGAYDLGYENQSGPRLFDELMQEMADDILEISSASARRLYNTIADGFKDDSNNNLQPILSFAGVLTNNAKATPEEIIASRVEVGETTGICPRTGVKLQLIQLKRHERNQLHNGLLELANSRFEEFTEQLHLDENPTDDYASKHLNTFANWLNNREGEPFTAIIDGANVAYYMQNFQGGSFNYYQIQFMVEALEKMKENPLVIIPFKYCSKYFTVTMGANRRQHFLDQNERNIIDNLTKRGQLYRVPPMCLDDYYWMLASVSEQTKSRKDTDLDVSVNNAEGRWPGARPMLISNDQMRDHKLGLMEPRLFRRWFGCYMVNYNFTAFVGQESVDREIGFSTADFFSREIQGHETDSGTVWHIPVTEWKLDDRLCIRIPK